MNELIMETIGFIANSTRRNIKERLQLIAKLLPESFQDTDPTITKEI